LIYRNIIDSRNLQHIKSTL